MATEKRDIELAIRAKDLSTASLQKVQKAVRDLAGGIEAQAKAAREGRISVAELRATLDQLEQAGRALANQQGLIDSYVKLSKALGDAETRAERAKVALTEFSAETARGAKLTEGQLRQQENYTKSIANAEKRLETARKRLVDFNAGLKEGEPLTEKQAARQERLAAAVERSIGTLSNARTRMDEFNAALARTSAERAANEQQRLEKAVQATGEAAQKQRAELTQLEAKLKEAGIDARNLADAQRQIVQSANAVGASSTALTTVMGSAARNSREAAQAARAQAQAERDAAKASEERAKIVERVRNAVKQQEQERERLLRAVRAAETEAEREAAQNAARQAERTAKQLADFRALADAAERTAQSFRSIAQAQRGTTQSQAQDAIARATGSTAAANSVSRRTLGGLEEVSRSAAGEIALLERARGPVQNFVGSLQDMERTLSRVQAVAKQVDGFRTQADATRRAAEAYTAAQDRLRQLQEQVRNAARPSDALAASLQQASVAANNAGAALVQQRARLVQLEQALQEAGIDTRRLGEAQERLARIARDTTQSIQGLQRVAQQRGVIEGERANLFGLSANELQNLSFQVNDFFTQISSGTSVTQAFAQQIGQVIQINRVGEFLARIAPAATGAVIAIGTVVAALVRLNSQFALLRDANAQQIFRGGGFGGEDVRRAANNIATLGASFADARRAALSFATLPLNLEQYRQATQIAGSLFAAFEDGQQRVDALRDALSRGVRGLLEFDERFGGLSAETRDYIVNARTAAEQSVALDRALRELAGTTREARDTALSPFSEAVIELRNAWRSFLDTLATSGTISTATGIVNGLTDAIEDLAVGLSELGPLLPILGAIGGGIAGGIPGVIGGTAAGLALTGAAGDRIRAAREARRARQQGAQGLPGGSGGATPPRDPADPSFATPEDVDAYFDALGRGQRAAEENERRRLAPIRERLDIMEREARLEREIRRGTEESATAAERAASVRAAAERAAADFARERNVAEDSDEAQRAGRIAAQRQQDLVDEAARRAADKNAREGLADRRRELTDIERDISDTQRIRDDLSRSIIEDVQRGALSSTEGLERLRAAAETARGRFVELAAEARRFAAQNRGTDALRDARADALTTRADRLAAGGGENSAPNQLLNQQRQALQQAVQERATFVQTINALEQQGAITSFEAQTRIRDAYAQTNGTINAQIIALEALVDELERGNQISATQAASLRAQIELTRAQLVLVDPAIARVRQAFEQSASNSVVQGFNDIAEAIGGVVAQTQEWGDVAEAAGRAVLNVFANVLRAIAEAIIRQQVLNAVQGAARAFGLAGPTVPGARLGGVVGAPGRMNNSKPRKVDPSWFVGAPHYSNGGLPGLRADEEAAILHRGEEVLTKDDPRNIMNLVRNGNRGGEGGGGEIGIRNVLVMDPGMIAEALTGSEGEKVVINTLRKNAATVRQIVR